MSVSRKSGIWLHSLSALLLAGCSSLGGAREPTPSEQKVIDRVVGMAFSPKSESRPREILQDVLTYASFDFSDECRSSLPSRQIHDAFRATWSEISSFAPTSREISGIDVQKRNTLVSGGSSNQSTHVGRSLENCPRPWTPYTQYGPIRLKRTIEPGIRYLIKVDTLENIRLFRKENQSSFVFETEDGVLARDHCSISMNNLKRDGKNVQIFVMFDQAKVRKDNIPSTEILACGARGFFAWFGLNEAANLPSKVIITRHAPFFRTSYERSESRCPPPLRYPGYYMLKETPLLAFYARNVLRLKKADPDAMLTREALRGALLSDLETITPLIIDISGRELKSLKGCVPQPVQAPAPRTVLE
jgi:hypothetical protein